MDDKKLKKLLESKFDDMMKHPIENYTTGYMDAINEVYIELEYGRLLGSNATRNKLNKV